jgi:uncharacterized membrane protein
MLPRQHTRAWTWISLLALVYILTFSILSVLRHDTFHSTTLDLGIMTQVVWNTSHGRWFETSIGRAMDTDLVGSYLGNHVRPILLFLAPLYRLCPDPRLLLILQSMGLGLAAVPLYHIVRRQVGESRTACIVVCCYLAYPALGFLNLVDFHPMALSIPLVFVAYWAMQTERKALFWATVVMALFCKEEMVVPIGMWGVVSLFDRERRRFWIALVIIAIVWTVLCFGLIIPYFNEGRSYRFWDLWAHLPGPSILPVDVGSAQSATRLSFETEALFLLHLFLPLGFLPFVGPASFMVALPALVYLLVGQRPALHSVGYQYPAVLIPWLFLAASEGLRRLRYQGGGAARRRLYRMGLAFMVFGTLGMNVVLNPILLYAGAGMFRPEAQQPQVVEAMAQIPPEAGVATINQFGSHLANRRVLVALEYPPPFRLDHVEQADYVMLDLVDCRVVPAADPRARYGEMVVELLATDEYTIRYWSGRILLLERGEPLEDEVEDVLDYVGKLVEQERPCWP